MRHARRITAILVVVSILLGLSGSAVFANVPGAIFTTDEYGTTNVNYYESKEDVYLNGGPRKPGAAGLEDGYYFVQVTAPNGSVLGTSVGGPGAFVEVSGGSFAVVYNLWSYFSFADSPNGVYKVWVSKDPDFPSPQSKTDNFRVGEGQPRTGALEVFKFHDLDANGVWDEGEEAIDGWAITVEAWDAENELWVVLGEFPTPVDLDLEPGLYRVTEASLEPWWRPTTGTCFEVGVAAGETTGVDFGNVQLGYLVVRKFHDLDGDGEQGQNEEDLQWPVTIEGPEYDEPLEEVTGFSAYVLPGDYSITEYEDPEWELTTGDNPVNVTVVGGEPTEVVFGNRQKLYELEIVKFYDANATGEFDEGDMAVDGWRFRVEALGQAGYTFLECYMTGDDPLRLPAGDYRVIECTPIQAYWMATTGTSLEVTLGPDASLAFGNLCLGAGGGHTIGFWGNKNGESAFNSITGALEILQGLNLRNATGSHFDPTSYAQFRTWLRGATATNMAYMLSAQLAAMRLNVQAGWVDPGALIYAPGTGSANALGFASVAQVMEEANEALGASGLTQAGHEDRDYQEALKNALDNANNNKTFVQASPCPFTFPAGCCDE